MALYATVIRCGMVVDGTRTPRRRCDAAESGSDLVPILDASGSMWGQVEDEHSG